MRWIDVAPGASVALLTLVGCASRAELRPEPESPPRLVILDQSANAPPPPPPTSPPLDANAPPPAARQSSQSPPAPPPDANASPNDLVPPTPVVGPALNADAPDAAHWAYEYPTGGWVYASGYGWIWVPANPATAEADGVPYTYLYTPSYGWTWYVSPWGAGTYHYGGWVRRPWRPVGWRGNWVAHPRVVVRLGGGPGPHAHRPHRRGW